VDAIHACKAGEDSYTIKHVCPTTLEGALLTPRPVRRREQALPHRVYPARNARGGHANVSSVSMQPPAPARVAQHLPGSSPAGKLLVYAGRGAFLRAQANTRARRGALGGCWYQHIDERGHTNPDCFSPLGSLRPVELHAQGSLRPRPHRFVRAGNPACLRFQRCRLRIEASAAARNLPRSCNCWSSSQSPGRCRCSALSPRWTIAAGTKRKHLTQQ